MLRRNIVNGGFKASIKKLDPLRYFQWKFVQPLQHCVSTFPKIHRNSTHSSQTTGFSQSSYRSYKSTSFASASPQNPTREKVLTNVLYASVEERLLSLTSITTGTLRDHEITAVKIVATLGMLGKEHKVWRLVPQSTFKALIYSLICLKQDVTPRLLSNLLFHFTLLKLGWKHMDPKLQDCLQMWLSKDKALNAHILTSALLLGVPFNRTFSDENTSLIPTIIRESNHPAFNKLLSAMADNDLCLSSVPFTFRRAIFDRILSTPAADIPHLFKISQFKCYFSLAVLTFDIDKPSQELINTHKHMVAALKDCPEAWKSQSFALYILWLQSTQWGAEFSRNISPQPNTRQTSHIAKTKSLNSPLFSTLNSLLSETDSTLTASVETDAFQVGKERFEGVIYRNSITPVALIKFDNLSCYVEPGRLRRDEQFLFRVLGCRFPTVAIHRVFVSDEMLSGDKEAVRAWAEKLLSEQL